MAHSVLATAAALMFGSALAQPAGTQNDSPPRPVQTRAIGSQTQYSDTMRRLLRAAQELRDASQAMAQEPPGPKRNEAMRAADQALHETQAAMLAMSPAMRRGDVPGPGYAKARTRLQQASENLRQTLQDLEDRSSGPPGDRAIDRTDEALFEAQQAMADLPLADSRP